MAWKTKVYVVLERLNVPLPNGDNVRLVDAFLTAEAADRCVDANPGTFRERADATK